MRKRKRRKTIMLMGFILIAVIAAGLVIWSQVRVSIAPTDEPHSVASASATSHKAVMPTANVQLLKQALNSPNIKEQSQALVVELRDEFVVQGQPILPSGTTVKLNPDTFLVYADNKSGQIEATTSVGQTFMLRLVLENGTWLVQPRGSSAGV